MPKRSVAGKEVGPYGSQRQSIWRRKRDLCYLIVRVDAPSNSNQWIYFRKQMLTVE